MIRSDRAGDQPDSTREHLQSLPDGFLRVGEGQIVPERMQD
jgi:hypothetical protein